MTTEIASQPITAINVKDFGAKGDGVTDDTDAIQKAVLAQAQRMRPMPKGWGDISYFPELVFPEGVYVLSRTIYLGLGTDPRSAMLNNEKRKGYMSTRDWETGVGMSSVRGEGKVVIRQKNPKADIFYVGCALRCAIENLTFDGGNRSIMLWTGNVDLAAPRIRNCTFLNSGSYAIAFPQTLLDTNADFVGYSVIEDNGELRQTGGDGGFFYLYHSTFFTVQDCEFRNCRNVLETTCDGGTMENCTIETSPDMKGAAIRIAGSLRLQNITGRAYVKEGNGQRWMDVDFAAASRLLGRDLRLTSTTDKGMCVVYSRNRYHHPSSVNPGVIILEDCEFQTSGCPENAVVYCAEAAEPIVFCYQGWPARNNVLTMTTTMGLCVPNQIYVAGCKETGNKKMPVLGFEGGVPGTEYFKVWPVPGGQGLEPQELSYQIEAGNENMICELPESMKPYARAPVPQKIREYVRQWTSEKKDDFLCRAGMKRSVIKQISALDFGTVGNGIADDTAAIQKAVDAAGAVQDGTAELIFPGAAYKITGVIDLPQRITIRAAGTALFWAPDNCSAGFSAKDAREIAFINCSLCSSTGNLLKFAIQKSAAAKILVDNCQLYSCPGTAIECYSLDPDPAQRLKTRLRIVNSVFKENKQALAHNVDAVADNIHLYGYCYTYTQTTTLQAPRPQEGRRIGHLIPGDTYRDIAHIKNDGRLRLENIGGVPYCPAFKLNIRWIDNNGVLLCDNFRSGGESGGMETVYMPANGQQERITIVQNGWGGQRTGKGQFPNDPDALKEIYAFVYTSVMPGMVVIRNNSNNGLRVPSIAFGPLFQFEKGLAAEDIFKKLFMSGNISYETVGCRTTDPQGVLPDVVPVPWSGAIGK